MAKFLFPSVLMVLGLTGSTLASPVLHFKSVQDATANPAQNAEPFAPGARPTRSVPEGLPGFYDPTTRNFTPLPSGAAPPVGPAYTGTVTVNLHVLSKDGEGIGPDDTVFCTLYLNFGNTAGSPPAFFVNHTVQRSTNFAAGEPVTAVAMPFSYTPNGSGAPYMQVTAICHVSSNNSTSFVGNDGNGVQPIGTTTVPLDMVF